MDYENDKYEYRLDLFGACMDHPGMIGEGITAGKHFFDTIEQLWYFFAEVQILKHKHQAGFLEYQVREGKNVRYFTRAKVLFMYEFITYQVQHDFRTVYRHEVAKHEFTTGFMTCDHYRSAMIKKTCPEFKLLPCGTTIELINIELEDLKYEKQQK